MTDVIDIYQQEISIRETTARKSPLQIVAVEEEYFPYTDYEVVGESGVRYFVEIRSLERKQNSCSCPDFHVNTLGTCKHIEGVLRFIRKQKPMLHESPRTEIFVDPQLDQITIFHPQHSDCIDYGLFQSYFSSENIWQGDPLENFSSFQTELENRPEKILSITRVSSYLEKWLAEKEFKRRCQQDEQLFHREVQEGRRSLQMLTCHLFPYQQQGMLHLAFKGRAILADEMGLGKTIQAIAACELLRKMGRIHRVLVVSPTSLKGEWEEQIGRFVGLPTLIVQGGRKRRLECYQKSAFFYLMNYEQLRNDVPDILSIMRPEVLILDEAQRIKNWRTKTATSVKRLKTDYAFVLTGTPIENRIDELYSIMQVVNPKILGPLFKFQNDFFEFDENEKAVKYKNLKRLHSSIEPVLLRRRKKDVEEQLPERTVKNYFLEMTQEQRNRYEEHEGIAAKLAKLAQKRPLTEEESKKLQRTLACMRMIADTPYILDEKCRDCPKLDELGEILRGYLEQEGSDTKIIIFSEWERMLLLVRELVDRLNINYAWHTGSVPQEKRRQDINKFKQDPVCRLFLTTDAGSTGLNLQVASVVINLDLPWNPAKLEQRIARAWRKMQTKHVQVINLVTENSIEHKMLATLAFKQSVADAVVDAIGDVDELSLLKEQWLKQFADLLVDEDEASSTEPLHAQAFKEALIARFQDRIHLVQQQNNTLLVVVDTKDPRLEGDIPLSSNQVEIIDLQTYLLLQRLASQGLIQLENNTKDNLWVSPLLQNTQKTEIEKRREKVLHKCEEAKRQMQMALLLKGGGFLQEALAPAEKSLEIAQEIISDLQLESPIVPTAMGTDLSEEIVKRAQYLEQLLERIQ